MDELAAAARICTMFPTRETRAKRCSADEEWASPQCGRAVGGGEVLLEDCGAVGNPLLDTGRIELAHIAVGSERIKGAARVEFARRRRCFARWCSTVTPVAAVLASEKALCAGCVFTTWRARGGEGISHLGSSREGLPRVKTAHIAQLLPDGHKCPGAFARRVMMVSSWQAVGIYGPLHRGRGGRLRLRDEEIGARSACKQQ